MVVFTCNNCGDSLQKPKVAKHYQFQCRSPIFLTCVDCLKDFRADEYVAHTKCITEDQRYGGKDYVPKPSANKGERKQQAWLTIVQNVLNTSKNLTVPERNLLSSISKHENIPRKKAKFLNFIKSISGNRVNMAIVESVWDKMESAFKEATADNKTDSQKNEKLLEKADVEENQNNSNIFREEDNVEETNTRNDNKKSETSQKKKKSKKRQIEGDENDSSQPASKRKNEIDEADVTQEETMENGANKFSWKNTILEIVTAKGEVSVKKLRKKVVAQYLAQFPESTSEKATSKFEKKLGKVSDILVADDKVKLASS